MRENIKKIDNCWNPINLPHCHGDQKLKIFNKYVNVSDLVYSFIIKVLSLPKVKPIFEAKNMDTVDYLFLQYLDLKPDIRLTIYY